MTRTELIQQLAKKFDGLSYKEIEMLIKTIFDDLITSSLASGRRVEIRGFGSLKSKYLQVKTARNPKTGDIVEVNGHYTVHFKPGKALRETVNQAALLDNANKQKE